MKRFFLLLILAYNNLLLTQYSNIRINKISSTSPEEVTISINPVNQNNLAAGANLNFSYYSTDGGYHWVEQVLTSSNFGVWGDPCVVFDAYGNLHYAHLSNPPLPGYWIDRIVVQRSTDGGITWNNGVGVGYNPPDKNQDKEWLAVDHTGSEHRNNIYMSWTEFDRYGSNNPTDSTRILFSRSTDGGLTWSSPVRLSDKGGNCIDSDSTVEGAVPAVGPNGEVYVSWSGPEGIMFDKSTDGGVTFGHDVFVTDQPGGWDLDVSGIFRCNGMPVTACDVSNSPFRGNIYINWSDQRYGLNNTDVFIIKSTDGGETWGSVIQVNDDFTGRHQFFTWMTVDQLTGYIYVVFYDRRTTVGDTTDVFVAKSVDGGETFNNFKVNTESFLPKSNIFFGDYTNIAALNGKVYPIWMRMDGSVLSVWTAIIDERRTQYVNIKEGWNLLSVPMYLEDYSNELLFPSAISDAFLYDGAYRNEKKTGRGYGFWMKFQNPQNVNITGVDILFDSVSLKSGWNIVGTISKPVAVNEIESNSPGMILSGFFEYIYDTYQQTDTLVPFKGYWVKSAKEGKLIFREKSNNISRNRIIIHPDNDTPPPPPDDFLKNMPLHFTLYQNYPNPFNSSTNITYLLPKESFLTLKIFNALGQEISTLYSGIKPAGRYTVIWNPENNPSGVYYLHARSSAYFSIMRLLYIK